MMLLPFLALVTVAAVQAGKVCQSDGGSNLFPFDGKTKVKMNFPCKYYALKEQKCGDLKINLVPGNRWIAPHYQLDSVWLGILNMTSGKEWEGRTTNKRAVKSFISSLQDDLFVQKDGKPAYNKLFDLKMGTEAPCVQVNFNGVFTFEYCAMDPLNPDYKKSYFRFECLQDMEENEYPKQMCGGSDFKEAWKADAEQLGLKERFKPMAIYYTNFVRNDDIVHTNEYCEKAVHYLKKKSCSKPRSNPVDTKLEQRVNVIKNCAPILYNERRAECLSAYSCSPMEAFNACLKWGCIDRFDQYKVKDRAAESTNCQATSELIYFCPTIAGPGNLTDRATASGCYDGFLPIDPPEGYEDMYPEGDGAYSV